MKHILIMKKVLFFISVFYLFFQCTMYQSETTKFIQVEKTHFVLNGKPYYFAGVNMWYACYLGATPEGKIRLTKELDTLYSFGIKNLRILGASEKSELRASLKPAIQKAPGVYDEKLLEGLDFALAEIGKRNMHAVIYLNNYWQWSGGMAQYVSWATGEKIPDADITNDWSTFMRYSARFYSTPKAIELNRNYIKYLINRTNKYTGLQYKDDPAIMAWELSNEPRPGTNDENGEQNLNAFIKWVDETAAYIHSLDSNHLVTSGTEGTVGCLQDSLYFLKVHKSIYIDYVNLHIWPKNWGWFDTYNIQETLDASIKNSIDYFNLHMELSKKLEKPITLEEFGIDRDNGKLAPGTSVKARNIYYKTIFSLVYDSAKNDAPIAGTNIWTWGGFGLPHPVTEVTSNAKAYLGDPLGEAQGLNSVYISDSSTIVILVDHANMMNGLTNGPLSSK